MRDGHRREYAADRERGSISFRDRSERALADVGIYRCVSFRDLADTHFGGHPYTTRRAVNAWIREGLANGVPAKGPKGRPFKVLTLTRKRSGRHPQARRRAGPGPRTAHQVRRPPAARPTRTRHGHLPGLRRRTPAPARAGRHHPARAPRRRAQERCRAPDPSPRVRNGRRAADAERHRAAEEVGAPHRRRGARALPRRADRVRRRRGAERTRQRRGRIGALPPGI